MFVSGKLLDLEKKVTTAEPMIKSLSAKNEILMNKVAILAVEAENDKERVAALEKSLQVEKDFCKLKDKQMGNLQFKLQKAGATAMQEFKDSDSYLNELCEYYMEGFELFRKWMAKHHPDLAATRHNLLGFCNRRVLVLVMILISNYCCYRTIYSKKVKKYIIFSNLKRNFIFFNNLLSNIPYIKTSIFTFIPLK